MIAAPPPPDEENGASGVGKIAIKVEDEGDAVKGEESSKKRKLEALEASHENGTYHEKGEAFSGAFPASKIREALQDGGYAVNVRDGAAVYLSAVLEQVTSRLLARAGTGVPDAPVKADRRIDPKSIQKALTEDSELQRFLAGMAGGGAEEDEREARDVVAGKCFVVDSWDASARDAAATALAATLRQIGVAALRAPPPPLGAGSKRLEEAYAVNPKAYSVLRLHAGFAAGMSALHAAQTAVLEQEVLRLQKRAERGSGAESNEEEDDDDEDEEEEEEEEEEKEDGEGGSAAGDGKKQRQVVKEEEKEDGDEEEGSGEAAEEVEEGPGEGGEEERVAAIVTGSKVWHWATAMVRRWRGEMSTDELLLLLELEQEAAREHGGGAAGWQRGAGRGGAPAHTRPCSCCCCRGAARGRRGEGRGAGGGEERWRDAVVIAALRLLSQGREELTVMAAGTEESGGVTGEEIVRELVWRAGGAEEGSEREKRGGRGREGLVSVRPNLGQFPRAAMLVREHAQVAQALAQVEGSRGEGAREGKGGHGVAYVNMALWGGKGHSDVRWLIVLLMARKIPLCLYSDIGQYVDNFVAYPSHGQKAL